MKEEHRVTTMKVPVDMLRPGLYVRELDRPWIETPFPFQGFRIAGAAELAALREYCRVVYIDEQRSSAPALQALRGEPERTGPVTTPAPPAPRRPGSRARRRSAGALFADTENPDRRRFTTLVRAAGAARADARNVAADALTRAGDGRMLDPRAVDRAVEGVLELVLEDATASLWLTRLQESGPRMAVHAVNTAVLALTLGARLELERAALQRLGVAAMLHEVGMTTLPAELLEKSEPLTERELARLRAYPQTGRDLVADSGGVHPDTLEAIRNHRERRDGRGYPRGLKSGDIPRAALIVGLADAYDAMTSRRPWAAPMAPDKALQALYGDAAGGFGVDLVQEFIHCMGIFPVGSVVELDNHARGVVVGARPGAGLWPTLLLVRTPEGEPYRRRQLLNLAATRSGDGLDGARRIARSIDPAAAGIDVARLVAGEFGLAA